MDLELGISTLDSASPACKVWVPGESRDLRLGYVTATGDNNNYLLTVFVVCVVLGAASVPWSMEGSRAGVLAPPVWPSGIRVCSLLLLQFRSIGGEGLVTWRPGPLGWPSIPAALILTVACSCSPVALLADPGGPGENCPANSVTQDTAHPPLSQAPPGLWKSLPRICYDCTGLGLRSVSSKWVCQDPNSQYPSMRLLLKIGSVQRRLR